MSSINTILGTLSSEQHTYVNYYYQNVHELESSSPPKEPVYVYESTSKAARIALKIFKLVLSFLFPLYGLYRLIHWVGGRNIVPAQTDPYAGILRKSLPSALCGFPPKNFTYNHNNFIMRKLLPYCKISEYQKNSIRSFNNSDNSTSILFKKASKTNQNLLIAKRISVLVDGKVVDAMIFGKKENLNNKKWVLVSNGNGSTMESSLAFSSGSVVEQINKLGVNFLFYNYQGVGASEGRVTRNSMVNTHKGMLRFLEDQEKGIGAKEIIQLGISIGGGVQGEAMKSHKLKEGIKYVLVKYLTFSSISKVPKNPWLGFLVKVFGWEFSSTASSIEMEKKKVPEIIIQRATQLDPTRASKIECDGLIHQKCAHAYSLLSKKTRWKHKKFIGVNLNHFEVPRTRMEKTNIIESIKEALSRNFEGFAESATAFGH